MSQGDELETWVLYDNPKDMPGYFVVRRFVVTKGVVLGTSEALWSRSADLLRVNMRKRGLTRIKRNPEDEPQIVETWI